MDRTAYDNPTNHGSPDESDFETLAKLYGTLPTTASNIGGADIIPEEIKVAFQSIQRQIENTVDYQNNRKHHHGATREEARQINLGGGWPTRVYTLLA